MAHLSEPWLTFETAGDAARVLSPSDPNGTVVPIQRVDEGGVTQVTGLHEGQPFALTISEATCQDEAELPYSHRAMVTWGATFANGCARLSTEPQPQEDG